MTGRSRRCLWIAVVFLLPIPVHSPLRAAIVACPPLPSFPAEALLVPFEQEGKWGYKDAGGRVVIPPRFSMALDFLETGIAPVVDPKAEKVLSRADWTMTGGFAYIDRAGKVILRPKFFDNGPDYFEDGLARYVENGKIGFFNEAGCKVTEAKFDAAYPFSEGRAAVCLGCRSDRIDMHYVWTLGKWGYIDTKGNMVIPAQYESAQSFEEGKANVSLNGKELVIDLQGKVVE